MGDMRYLADSTSLDISFANTRLAQYTFSPHRRHMELLLHLLKYFKEPIDLEILFKDAGPRSMDSYAYAEYTNSHDRKSTPGTIYIAFGAPITWSSRKHNSNALSTCEAAYIAVNLALKKTLWLHCLISNKISSESTSVSKK